MSLDVTLTCKCCDSILCESNITHNLTDMARAAGVYCELWRPEEEFITDLNLYGEIKAVRLIRPLEGAIRRMKSAPTHFRQYDAPNGWGTYDDFLRFCEEVLKGCKAHPASILSANR